MVNINPWYLTEVRPVSAVLDFIKLRMVSL